MTLLCMFCIIYNVLNKYLYQIRRWSLFLRRMANIITQRAQKIPVLALLGPRQSGKTTLTKATFSNHAYVSLETFEDRELADSDPKGFFESHKNAYGIIIDEIQRVPKLLSYIQTMVDNDPKPGYFILTGSQNILINQAISQTLAGRIAIFTLLPFSINELKENSLLNNLETLAYIGCYPRIYAYNLEATPWYLDYIETYVERDVRQIASVNDLSTFRRFIRLCAGRIGQLVNIASLANDCSIDQRTAKSWLSILEASYIVFLLQPHYENFSKRLIKSPKIYFYDTGLACALLDIQSQQQLDDHYLRGNLIESLIISDVMKHYYNTGNRPHNVYFWRDQSGHEIDCIIQRNNKLIPIEIKAGKTIVNDFFKVLTYWDKLTKASKKTETGYVIYGGSNQQKREHATVVSWQNVEDIFKE